MKKKNPPQTSRQAQSQRKTPRNSITLSTQRADGRQMIANAKLEAFPNRTTHRKYWVEFTCPEFTCFCPASGFPDFATLFIRYVPKNKCVELKSLKLYINQFRDKGIFHEDVTNVIMDDLIKLLDPWVIEVTGDFGVRGNIKTIIKSKHFYKGYKLEPELL
jgi:7-cyano-7-deazaguanine reductase